MISQMRIIVIFRIFTSIVMITFEIFESFLFAIKFVKFESIEFFHFDTIIIFRVKIMHRVLKSMIKFSTSDLMIVVNDIEIMIMNQLMIYRIDIEKKK